MTPDIRENVARIKAFNSDHKYLLQLDADCMALFDSGRLKHYVTILFDLFERFPDEDNEVFWGIMHGLETLSGYGYEEELLNSVSRQPSVMGVRMLGRIVNSGADRVGEVNLLELLRAIVANPAVSATVRTEAEDRIAYQTQKRL